MRHTLQQQPELGVRAVALAGFVLLVAIAGCGEMTKNNDAPPRTSSSPSGQGAVSSQLPVDGSLPAEAVPSELGATDRAAAPSNGYLASIAQSVSKAYESAKNTGQTAAVSARDWLMNEISSDNRWEFRVIVRESDDPQVIERQLNALGRDGWQCFHVETGGASPLFYMQRRPPSITQNIPLSDLLKAIPYLGFGGGG